VGVGVLMGEAKFGKGPGARKAKAAGRCGCPHPGR